LDDAVEKLGQIQNAISLYTTNYNRKIAAEKQVEAVEAAYDAGTVTFDLLMDAQRRELDAHNAYAESLLDVDRLAGGLGIEMERIYALLNLEAAKQARARALRAWQKVHGKFVQGQADVKLEAVAREQYFLFRKAVETALLDYHRVNEPERKQSSVDELEGTIQKSDDNQGSTKTHIDRRIAAKGTESGYQEWQAPLSFQMPIGLRRELSAIRHQQLQLARKLAVMRDVAAE
jgi:hypothetical protein